MSEDYKLEIIECKRKIALDRLDIYYQLARLQIFYDKEDNKSERLRYLMHQKIKRMDQINNLAEEMIKSE